MNIITTKAIASAIVIVMSNTIFAHMFSVLAIRNTFILTITTTITIVVACGPVAIQATAPAHRGRGVRARSADGKSAMHP